MHWAEYVCNEQTDVVSAPWRCQSGAPDGHDPPSFPGQEAVFPFHPPTPLPSALLVLLFFHTCFVALCGFSISMTTLHWPRSGKTKFFQKGQIIIVVGSAGPAASVVIGEA